jgi:hypothetical protein
MSDLIGKDVLLKFEIVGEYDIKNDVSLKSMIAHFGKVVSDTQVSLNGGPSTQMSWVNPGQLNKDFPLHDVSFSYVNTPDNVITRDKLASMLREFAEHVEKGAERIEHERA